MATLLAAFLLPVWGAGTRALSLPMVLSEVSLFLKRRGRGSHPLSLRTCGIKSSSLETKLEGERGRQKITSPGRDAIPGSLNWTTGLGRIV